MSKRWHAFGYQRTWPNGEGSVWVEDSGDAKKPWGIHCSSCDTGEFYRYASQAKAAADKHVKDTHR